MTGLDISNKMPFTMCLWALCLYFDRTAKEVTGHLGEREEGGGRVEMLQTVMGGIEPTPPILTKTITLN